MAKRVTALSGDVTNDAASTGGIMGFPYDIEVIISGTSPLLFHRWSNEDVKAKDTSGKGSKVRKTDNIESYLWRDGSGNICMPGEYLRMSLCNAAKFFPDPRGKNRMLGELAKAGFVVGPRLSTMKSLSGDPAKWREIEDPHAIDQRRVRIKMAAITRSRPMIEEGWQASFNIRVLASNYLPPNLMRQVIDAAGGFCGLGDFRPTFGRFVVNEWRVKEYAA